MDQLGSGSITWEADVHAEVSTGDISASHKSRLNIQFFNPRNIDEIISLVYALEMYFCFAATIFSGPPEVYLSIEEADKTGPPAQLLLHAPWYEAAKQVHPLNQYFGIAHFKQKAGQSLSGWLDAFNRYGHAPKSLFYCESYN